MHRSTQAKHTWFTVLAVACDSAADGGLIQTVHQANEAPSCLVFLFCLSALLGRPYVRRLRNIVGFIGFRTIAYIRHKRSSARNMHTDKNQ